MELKRGTVVYTLAGHDKNTFQVVVDFDDKYVMVCDGKYRPLERVKKKKLIHLKLTNTVLDESVFKSNRSVKNALKPFNKRGNAID